MMLQKNLPMRPVVTVMRVVPIGMHSAPCISAMRTDGTSSNRASCTYLACSLARIAASLALAADSLALAVDSLALAADSLALAADSCARAAASWARAADATA
ncbi:uncharacterized protein LOC126990779 [Eriocheir sinensis]|uniref:uncharacterized protein LOC126990779 n=1 Tax=Eriocheir sinensis TaxID=95602 RepID=UPI0021C7AE15|nr:uncharacterized protein LOC126990779 [Eriocheir sinensis]